LYEPANYILSLGGKRIRPLLCLIAAELVGGEATDAFSVAKCVEYFHNFSLVHDDIMDNAALRRGKQTIHERYGLNTAILSGDVMLVCAYELLTENVDKYLPYLLQVFNRTARQVCEGQQYDMLFETATEVSIKEYLRMIELKTAVLLGASLQMGAIVGGANKRNRQMLYEYGRHIGIAFQLQDDILDTFGDEKTFGKKIGGDILQNKKTFLLIKALELADPTTQTKLHFWINEPKPMEQEKIAAVTQIYQQLGVLQLAQAEMQNHYNLATRYLDDIAVAEQQKTNLRLITQQLMHRVQ
jgi:geranylgeranyl diphosphate synthase type II